MIGAFEFVVASLALLATPGPTNTLLAAAAASAGVRRALVLLPAELAGYATSVAALTWIVGPSLATQPLFARLARVLAAVVLAIVAARLWRGAGRGAIDDAPIRPAQVFFTTLVNPKALVFAFAILPQFPVGERHFAVPYVATLAVLIVLVGFGWIGAGGAVRASASRPLEPRTVRRAGAVVIGLLSVVLLASALRG